MHADHQPQVVSWPSLVVMETGKCLFFIRLEEGVETTICPVKNEHSLAKRRVRINIQGRALTSPAVRVGPGSSKF